MSRKPMSRKCFRIIAGLIILSFGFAVPATAQRTASLPMIPAPTMPPTMPAFSHQSPPLFLSLLDDVILKKQIETDISKLRQACELSPPCDGTCQSDCQCNLETIASESELEKACEEVDEWAALMTCPCDLKNCGGGCETTSTVDESTMAFAPIACKGCQRCNDCIAFNSGNVQSKNDADDYCKTIAQLLTATLENSNSSSKEKQKAVEAAMKLVAQKALETADVRILDLKIAHAQAIQAMELKLVRANTQAEAMQELETWMRPIYQNQYRNNQQLRLLAASSTSLHRSVSTWERKMVAAMAKVPTPTSRPTTTRGEQETGPWYAFSAEPASPINQNANRARYSTPKPILPVDNEVTHLKRELAEMAKRIENLQSNSVTPAGHLEPIYVPDAELQPLMPNVKMLPRYRR